MAEQQLVDYIKKAKEAGQTDDQTRNLLTKNGWTEAEISDAFLSIGQPQQPQVQPQMQPQMQAKPEPQIISQTKVEIKPQTIVQPQTQPQIQPQQPQVQPQTQFRPAQSNMPNRKGGLHAVLKLFIVLIVVVLLGGTGLYVAGQFYNLPFSLPFSNLFGANPQTVIKNMMANMQNVKTEHSNMLLEINATDNKKVSQGKLSLNINGDSDVTDVKNPKGNFALTVNVTMPGTTSPVAAADLSVTTISGVEYLKLNNLTIPEEFSFPGLDISGIQGKWLKIDQASVNTLSKESGAEITIPQQNNAELTKKIQDLFVSENLLSNVKQLSDQTINGQNTYRYSITINNAKIKDLLNKVIDLQQQTQTPSTSENGQSAISYGILAKSFINPYIEKLGDLNMEISIGKKDYMLYGVKIEKSVDMSQLIGNTGEGSGGVAAPIISIKFDITNSNFNKPVAIQAPADSQKFEDVLAPLMGGQEIKSDMSQINDIAVVLAERYSNYSALCINKNFITLSNDIVSQGAVRPVCFAGVKDYCVSTQLAKGGYVCIDKTGKTGTVKCISAKTVCNPLP